MANPYPFTANLSVSAAELNAAIAAAASGTLSGAAWAAGVTAFLQAPSSANLRAALTDARGTGPMYFGQHYIHAEDDFGAVGDGVTDDTVSIQAAIDAAAAGTCVLLAPGKVYRVQNLTLPTSSPASFVRKGLVCMGGGNATIKAISGGDTSYLVASSRWVSNSVFADQPWIVDNIIFDANNIADIAFVLKGYSTEFHRCQFKNGLDTSFLFTRRNKDGSDGTSGSFLSGFVAFDCDFQSSTNYCFRTEGIVADPTQSPADGTLLSCTLRDANFYLANTAGWLFRGNRTWGQDEVAFDNLSRGFVCDGNNFDANEGTGVVKVQRFASSFALAQLGPGNVFYKPLVAEFTDDSSSQELVVHGNTFWTNAGYATDAYIEHRNNRAAKVITSRNNNFRSTNPHRLGAGVTLGTYRVEGGRDGNGPMPHDGLILPDYSETSPASPSTGLRIVSRKRGGIRRPAIITPDGIAMEMERLLIGGCYGALIPTMAGANPVNIGGSVSVTGTATARTWANTNVYTQARRCGAASAASANSSAGFRIANPPWWRGNAAGLGGYEIVIRGGIAAYQSGMRAFFGVINNTVPSATVDPSDTTNIDFFGIGKDAADTTWALIYNDNAGAATKADLGANFPANTSATDIYELRLFCKPNDTILFYSVKRLNTGDIVDGSANANLPRSQITAGPLVWANTGAGTVAVEIDLFGISANSNADI